jgi:hypothetical protein
MKGGDEGAEQLPELAPTIAVVLLGKPVDGDEGRKGNTFGRREDLCRRHEAGW